MVAKEAALAKEGQEQQKILKEKEDLLVGCAIFMFGWIFEFDRLNICRWNWRRVEI